MKVVARSRETGEIQRYVLEEVRTLTEQEQEEGIQRWVAKQLPESNPVLVRIK